MRRSNGTRMKLHLSRWAIIALAVVLALGSVGVTYASWKGGSEPAYCDTVHTYCFHTAFTWVVSNDDGTTSSVSPHGTIDPGDNGNDPSEPQDLGSTCARYAKNVALTTAYLTCKCDPHYITVTVCNGYPCYHPTVFFGMKNFAQVDSMIEAIIIDENYTGCGDTTADDIPDLDVSYGGIYIGQVIPACSEVTGSLRIHVEQPAKENWTYKIKLKIKLKGDYSCGGGGRSTGHWPWIKWKKHHHHKRHFKCQDINTPVGTEEGWLIYEKNISDPRKVLI